MAGELIWTMLCIIVWSQNVQGQGCKQGCFGKDCQYKCRRINSNNNGLCTGRCLIGWFGPECQYQDLIGPSGDASHTPYWIRDNNETSCNDGKTSNELTINLTSEYPFTWLRLKVNNQTLIQDFKLTFTDKRNVTRSDCNNMRHGRVNDKTLDIHCDLDFAFQYLIITGDGVKSLCSLYISGGRNIALCQNAAQSSTYDRRSIATKAVDGYAYNMIEYQSCTATSYTDLNPNLNVTFTRSHTIYRYVLYNRDTGKEQLQNFTLRSFTQSGKLVFNHTDKQNTTLDMYTILSVKKTQPILLVDITNNYTGRDVFLTLCEVEIYGDSACEHLRYGPECEHTCNCAVTNETCFVSTGGCPSGCSTGFQGESCDKTCDIGKYGEGCRFNCSQFCVLTNNMESSCQHINGTCILGYQNGYQPPTCHHLIIDDNHFSAYAIAGTTIFIGILIISVISAVIIRWRRRAIANRNMAAATQEDEFDYELIIDSEDEPSRHNRVNHVTVSTQTSWSLMTEHYSSDTVYYNTVSGMSST